ncbi:hypothetical protein N8940_01815 [Sphingomonadaceae bacterium]|nr:hypothetical protein [Sphingomonadaceae bacterium]
MISGVFGVNLLTIFVQPLVSVYNGGLRLSIEQNQATFGSAMVAFAVIPVMIALLVTKSARAHIALLLIGTGSTILYAILTAGSPALHYLPPL